MSVFNKFGGLRVLLLPATVGAALLAWSMPSLLIAKKVAGLLILPAGLVWLGLMAITCMPGLCRRARLFAVMVLLFYTLSGNAWIGGWLLSKLESPYAAVSAPPEPFDAICVLGGGSSVTPDGRAQLGPAGDRLLVPARLFLKGRSRHLVTSGLSVTDIGGKRSLADDTAAVWLDLGVPETAITRLSEPRATSEEIRVYRELIAKNGWQRVGICSSAWHLRRVMNLCSKEGVNMIPVPSDFLSSELPWTPLYAVPQARGFQNVQKALWEYIGALAGN